MFHQPIQFFVQEFTESLSVLDAAQNSNEIGFEA